MLHTYRVIASSLRMVHSHRRLSSILTAVPCFRKGADSVSTRNIQDIHPSLVSNGTRCQDMYYSRPPNQVTKIGIAILSFSDNSYVSITSLRTSTRLVCVCRRAHTDRSNSQIDRWTDPWHVSAGDETHV